MIGFGHQVVDPFFITYLEIIVEKTNYFCSTGTGCFYGKDNKAPSPPEGGTRKYLLL
jgi:hypothetical protein